MNRISPQEIFSREKGGLSVRACSLFVLLAFFAASVGTPIAEAQTVPASATVTPGSAVSPTQIIPPAIVVQKGGGGKSSKSSKSSGSSIATLLPGIFQILGGLLPLFMGSGGGKTGGSSPGGGSSQPSVPQYVDYQGKKYLLDSQNHFVTSDGQERIYVPGGPDSLKPYGSDFPPTSETQATYATIGGTRYTILPTEQFNALHPANIPEGMRQELESRDSNGVWVGQHTVLKPIPGYWNEKYGITTEGGDNPAYYDKNGNLLPSHMDAQGNTIQDFSADASGIHIVGKTLPPNTTAFQPGTDFAANSLDNNSVIVSPPAAAVPQSAPASSVPASQISMVQGYDASGSLVYLHRDPITGDLTNTNCTDGSCKPDPNDVRIHPNGDGTYTDVLGNAKGDYAIPGGGALTPPKKKSDAEENNPSPEPDKAAAQADNPVVASNDQNPSGSSSDTSSASESSSGASGIFDGSLDQNSWGHDSYFPPGNSSYADLNSSNNSSGGDAGSFGQVAANPPLVYAPGGTQLQDYLNAQDAGGQRTYFASGSVNTGDGSYSDSSFGSLSPSSSYSAPIQDTFAYDPSGSFLTGADKGTGLAGPSYSVSGFSPSDAETGAYNFYNDASAFPSLIPENPASFGSDAYTFGQTAASTGLDLRGFEQAYGEYDAYAGTYNPSYSSGNSGLGVGPDYYGNYDAYTGAYSPFSPYPNSGADPLHPGFSNTGSGGTDPNYSVPDPVQAETYSGTGSLDDY